LVIKYLDAKRIRGTAAERAAMTTAGVYTYDSTNDGATTGSAGNANNIMASRTSTQLSQGDIIGTIGFEVYATNNQPYNFKFAVYTESNSTTPSTLLCNTANITPTGTGWLDFPVEFSGGAASTTHTMAGDGYVWIAQWGSGSIFYKTSGVESGGTKQHNSVTYVVGDQPVGTFSVGTTHNSEMTARVGIQTQAPVYPNLPAGTIFEQTDDYKYYMWNGTSAWTVVGTT